jgi:hypothetical protein
MVGTSAAGPGIKDGTRETERDISMAKLGRRRKWTDKELNDVKSLVEHNFSASKIGEIFKTTKNAVIGALYRDKVRNGYVPPPDSKYTGAKNL